MHNGQLADPLNKWSKAIKELTSKGKKKTDADIAEIQRLEWFGGLYLNEDLKPCWPGDNIEAMVKVAARATKRGKDVERGLLCEGNWPLAYDGPKNMDDLFLDDRFRMVNGVVVNNKRVMRTRPQFPVWSLDFVIQFLREQLNPEDIRTFLDYAGVFVTLSDRRPKYGKFEVTRFEAA